MTIGFGCLCRDGIVLGADTQLTAAGYHKSYGRKLFICESKTWNAIVTYSGSPVFINDFCTIFKEELCVKEANELITIQVIRNVITSVLMRYVESDVNSNHLLIGVRANSEISLLRTQGYSVSTELEGQPARVGAGDSSVLAFVLPLVAQNGVANMQQAALVAVFAIEMAKKYVDGCGGETEVMSLPKIGGSPMLWADSDDLFEFRYNIVPVIESDLADALSEMFAGRGETKALNKAIDEMCESLKLNAGSMKYCFKPSTRRRSKDRQ